MASKTHPPLPTHSSRQSLIKSRQGADIKAGAGQTALQENWRDQSCVKQRTLQKEVRASKYPIWPISQQLYCNIQYPGQEGPQSTADTMMDPMIASKR
jgi:hypothetical protein